MDHEQPSVVVLAVKNYTGNVSAGDMNAQLGEILEIVDHVETLQMDITTKSKELFNIYTRRELFDGVLTHIPYDRNNPKSSNTGISNYKPNDADKLTSGVADLSRCSSTCSQATTCRRLQQLAQEAKRRW